MIIGAISYGFPREVVRGSRLSFDEALVRDEVCYVLTMGDGDRHMMAETHFMSPADGVVTSFYGRRRDPFQQITRVHRGLDIANFAMSIVRAAAPGTVRFAGRRGGYGNMAIIEHADGYETWYCHLKHLCVKGGDRIEGGQVIGEMGSTGRSTGRHLHFEVRQEGVSVDPLPHLVVGRVGISSAG